MPLKRIRVGPQIPILRAEDVAVFQRGQMTGPIERGLQVAGQHNPVPRGDANQALIERPVTQAAKRHAVARVVVVTDAPGDDVGRLNDAVPVRGHHAYAAKGAAVAVKLDDGAPEPLVAHRGLQFICGAVAHFAPWRCNQLLPILEGFQVSDPLCVESLVQFGRKVSLDQDAAQRTAGFIGVEQLE